MDQKETGKVAGAAAGGDDFETLFEESMRSVKPGEVVKGRVVGVTATHVMIDVGYKSEGQIPLQEFLDRGGNVQVKVGDEVDVFFDSSEGENGAIVLSRQRAENIKVWEEIEKAYREGSGVEGVILAKVKGGFKVDVGVPGFLPGSHVDVRPTRNLDKFVGARDRFAVLKYNRPRGNVVVSRRVLLEKEREVLKKEILKVLEEGVHANLDFSAGATCSGRVMLALVGKGMAREAAYRLVQRCARRAQESGLTFAAVISSEPAVRRRLTTAELAGATDFKRSLAHVDTIYGRVLGRKTRS